MEVKALDLHNQYREKHHAPDLELDDELNSLATQCAEYYANQGQIDHTCPYKEDNGENLAGGEGSWDKDEFAEMSTNMWYDEADSYDYDNPGFSGATGHFTQLV
ncbi:Golgi-associated plant pathogenesis-related protein 1 [Pseudolycoriella hygida]|uniref:Golgi-associated plant pathogenesis-related protein 1 n=1 Tax=Pseudolycoriella hygida TaxID=35572 RepID=A0A9Q0S2F4_9DIPT|nr:Golgi-associated plant pathogenesis-related protein 1 [Pseudolycoriella hygida]